MKSFRQPGYITLISTLVVGAVGLSVVMTTIMLGLGSSRSAFSLQRSAAAESLANACITEALEQVRENTNYSSTGNLTLTGGTCAYSVVNTGGSNRDIFSTGQSGPVVRKIKVTLTGIEPDLIVASWRDVADF